MRLAKRAFETWAAVEAEADERIVTVTGGLDLWPADPGIPMADYTDSLAAEAVPFEILDAAEVMRRWPQWRLPDDVTAMWQSRAGLADPYRGNAAHRRLATAHGATLVDRTPVTAIREVGGAYEVDAGGTTHTAGRVILAADAWTNELLAAFDRRLPLTVTKEQVTYFAAADPAAFAPDRFPVWIWMDEPSFYGIPTYGEAGPKAAQDAGGQATTPETRTFERDDAMFERVRRFVETYLPGAAGPELLTKTCLYTLTPDRDFVVDRVPDAPGVVVGLGAGARVQVRVGPGPRPGRARARRRHRRRTARSARSASIARSCSRRIRRRAGSSEGPRSGPFCCVAPPRVPPYGHSAGTDESGGGYWRRGGDGPSWRRYRCDRPCVLVCGASSLPRG